MVIWVCLLVFLVSFSWLSLAEAERGQARSTPTVDVTVEATFCQTPLCKNIDDVWRKISSSLELQLYQKNKIYDPLTKHWENYGVVHEGKEEEIIVHPFLTQKEFCLAMGFQEDECEVEYLEYVLNPEKYSPEYIKELKVGEKEVATKEQKSELVEQEQPRTCSDCGSGLIDFNLCDKEECESLGCQFIDKFWVNECKAREPVAEKEPEEPAELGTTKVEKIYNRYKTVIDQASKSTIVPVSLLIGVMAAETDGTEAAEKAVSPCSAAGIVQFIPGTALQYGLKVQFAKVENIDKVNQELAKIANNPINAGRKYSQLREKYRLYFPCDKCKSSQKNVLSPCNTCNLNTCNFTTDERFMPAKAIPAAARYLQKLYQSNNLNNWDMAVKEYYGESEGNKGIYLGKVKAYQTQFENIYSNQLKERAELGTTTSTITPTTPEAPEETKRECSKCGWLSGVLWGWGCGETECTNLGCEFIDGECQEKPAQEPEKNKIQFYKRQCSHDEDCLEGKICDLAFYNDGFYKGIVPHPICVFYPNDQPNNNCAYLRGRLSTLRDVDYRIAFCNNLDDQDKHRFNQMEDRVIDQVIIHYTAGLTVQSALDAWQGEWEASAHYIIDKNGEIYSVVDEIDKAWHAEEANTNSIGIELVNLGYDCSEKEYSAQCPNFIEQSGKRWETYPEKQMNSLVWLAADIAKRYDLPIDRNTFKGHQDVITSKSDPGPAFNWNNFLERVQGIVEAKIE